MMEGAEQEHLAPRAFIDTHGYSHANRLASSDTRRGEAVSFKRRLSYMFDNLFSHGPVTLVGLLLLLALVVVILIAAAMTLIDVGLDLDVGDAFWSAFSLTINPEPPTLDEGNLSFAAIVFVAVILGLIITSLLVGIMTNAVSEKFRDVRWGATDVVENGHTVILGFDKSVFGILKELSLSHTGRRKKVVVVMGDETKGEMDAKIKQYVGDLPNMKVVCRTGSITDAYDVRRCSLPTARAVIVNEKDDTLTIKALLAVDCVLSEAGVPAEESHVVCSIAAAQNLEAAAIAGNGRAQITLFSEVLSKIVAQTCYQPGMSFVFSELLDFSGSELYLFEFPELTGKTFTETQLLFDDATPVGVEREEGGQRVVHLCPHEGAPGYVLAEGDRLVCLAVDDTRAKPLEASPALDGVGLAFHPSPHRKQRNILVIGYDELFDTILFELDNYLGSSSHVMLACLEDKKRRIELHSEIYTKRRLPVHFTVAHRFCARFDCATIDSLMQETFDHVIILSDSQLDDDAADAKTLLVLLYLRNFASREKRNFNITCEMVKEENRDLARNPHVSDFIISSNLVAMIQSQIAETKELCNVFDMLLRRGDGDIFLRDASDFVEEGTESVDYAALCRLVADHGQVLLGYKHYLPTSNERGALDFEVVINPVKSERAPVTSKDMLVVLDDLFFETNHGAGSDNGEGHEMLRNSCATASL